MEFLYEQLGFRTREELRIEAEEIMISASHYQPDIIDWVRVYSCIDHTSLEGIDNDNRISDFARKVRGLGDTLPGKNHVAAVCTYPVFVSLVADILKGTQINTACVAGAFPSGLSPLWLRLDEVRYALENGADEIDMVISRGRLLSGDYNFVYDEVARFKEICNKKLLKVILETGELSDPLQIARASEIALRAGADFLKTSTGKATIGYTPEALLVMMDCVKAFYKETGQKRGIKVAGGISEPEYALDCTALGKQVLGEDWINPRLFRIGASRLTEKVANRILSGNAD